MNLEDDLDALYGLPRSEFVPARNKLAKSLRESGDRERADEVRGLEKPSLPAWAINQLARRDPETVRRLATVGEMIGEIQSGALAGRSAEGLREASTDQLAAVGALMERARRDLADELSASALDRVEIALRNASTDEAARALLLNGRLVTEPEAVGFGALAGLPVAAGERPKRPRRAAEDPRRARVRKLREKVAEARRALAASEKGAREADRVARAAAKQVEQERKRVQKLEAQLEQAKQR